MGGSPAGYVSREPRQTRGRARPASAKPGMPRTAQDRVLGLQRAAGNQAVTRLLYASQAAAGQPLDAATRGYFEARFGQDFSEVRVHTDAAAVRSAEDVQATAYTVGNDIVLGADPLGAGPQAGRRVLAHELAHVVQQRGGGVSPGPAQEADADAAVRAMESGTRPDVRARSGVGLAAQAAPPIRRQPAKPALTADQAEFAIWQLEAVLVYEDKSAIGDPRSPRQAALAKLFAAVTGRDLQGRKVGGRESRESLDEAVLGLRDVVEAAPERDRATLRALREKLFGEEAGERIEQAVVVEGKVIETSDERHPEEEAEALHELLLKLVKSLSLANEQLHRLSEANVQLWEEAIHAIEHSPQYEKVEAFLETIEKDFHRAETVVHTIGVLQALLGTIDGLLTLNKKEFKEHLNEVPGKLSGVASFVELVKVGVELGVGSASLVALIAGGLMKVEGEAEWAASAFEVAGELGGALANAVAAVEIVHGILVLFDPHASRAEKESAAVGVATGTAWFVGRRIGGAMVGGPASIAILGGYYFFKYSVALYWEGALAVNTLWMNQTFQYMKDYGEHFARVGDEAARASLLLEKEHDPLKAKPLAQALASSESMLAVGLADFLDHARPGGAKDMGWVAGDVTAPGNVPILAETFAPLQRYRGVKSGSQLPEAVGHVLVRIAWALQNAQEIITSSTRPHDDLSDVVRGPTKATPGMPTSREAVLREIGPVSAMRVEFKVDGYRSEDAKIVATHIAGLDLLWFLIGADPTLTLADLGLADIVFEGHVGGQPVTFRRDATGHLTYDESVSTTGDYFRAVAKTMGQGQPTMQQESLTGMVDVYSTLIATPLVEANLRH
jgi:hypothetical protein